MKSRGGTNRLDDDRWKPLDRGKFMINVDDATNNRYGACGLSIIIRDFTGEVIHTRAIHWPFRISVEVAEATTIKWSIITALEACLFGFSIASDCTSIVNVLNNKIISLCKCGIILDEILNFLLW